MRSDDTSSTGGGVKAHQACAPTDILLADGTWGPRHRCEAGHRWEFDLTGAGPQPAGLPAFRVPRPRSGTGRSRSASPGRQERQLTASALRPTEPGECEGHVVEAREDGRTGGPGPDGQLADAVNEAIEIENWTSTSTSTTRLHPHRHAPVLLADPGQFGRRDGTRRVPLHQIELSPGRVRRTHEGHRRRGRLGPFEREWTSTMAISQPQAPPHLEPVGDAAPPHALRGDRREVRPSLPPAAGAVRRWTRTRTRTVSYRPPRGLALQRDDWEGFSDPARLTYSGPRRCSMTARDPRSTCSPTTTRRLTASSAFDR